jgi:hypothetical protein
MKKTSVCRQAIAAVLSVIIAAPAFGATTPNSYNIVYDGGSVQGVKTGNELKLFIEGDQIRFMWGKKEEAVVIPASAVTEISCGQDVHRRVGAAIGVAVVSLGVGALLALTKSKKHYVRPDLGRRRTEGRHGDPMRQVGLSRCAPGAGRDYGKKGGGFESDDGEKLRRS